MPHKAGSEFFDAKKDWSRRKDLILEYYLSPYLAKVAHLHRPILIVDGFAGPGRFGDNQSGSPLLICDKAKVAVERGAQTHVWCIEQDVELFQALEQNLKQYTFATAKNGTFLSQIDAIERCAQTHSVFLYLDPFTVEGLEWTAMDRIFAHLSKSKSSIELLLNFNAASFARRGLAALKMVSPPIDTDDVDDKTAPSIERLHQVVGGDWWIVLLKNIESFEMQVNAITEEFGERLQARFKEVCIHPVKEKVEHTIPKYILIFCSRHPDALLLMNEAMVRSREKFAASSLPSEGTLFETRPFEVVPDMNLLPQIVLECCEREIIRKQLILNVVRVAFCDYGESQIKTCIRTLIAEKKLQTVPAHARLNDGTVLKRATSI